MLHSRPLNCGIVTVHATNQLLSCAQNASLSYCERTYVLVCGVVTGVLTGAHACMHHWPTCTYVQEALLL